MHKATSCLSSSLPPPKKPRLQVGLGPKALSPAPHAPRPVHFLCNVPGDIGARVGLGQELAAGLVEALLSEKVRKVGSHIQEIPALLGSPDCAVRQEGQEVVSAHSAVAAVDANQASLATAALGSHPCLPRGVLGFRPESTKEFPRTLPASALFDAACGDSELSEVPVFGQAPFPGCPPLGVVGFRPPLDAHRKVASSLKSFPANADGHIATLQGREDAPLDPTVLADVDAIRRSSKSPSHGLSPPLPLKGAPQAPTVPQMSPPAGENSAPAVPPLAARPSPLCNPSLEVVRFRPTTPGQGTSAKPIPGFLVGNGQAAKSDTLSAVQHLPFQAVPDTA